MMITVHNHHDKNHNWMSLKQNIIVAGKILASSQQ